MYKQKLQGIMTCQLLLFCLKNTIEIFFSVLFMRIAVML